MPEKRPTLPRLELLSCELAAGLVKTITSAIKIEWQVTCWSDSKVALGWIRENTQRWKQFVQNRVLFITNNTCSSWWRHVPGLENPADLCSREASAGKLIPASIWWHGPSWLSADSSHWKMETAPTCDETTTSLIENEIYACRGDGNSPRVTTNQMVIHQLVLQVSSNHRVDQTSEEKHRLT